MSIDIIARAMAASGGGGGTAGDINYDPSEEYIDGTVGAALTQQSQHIEEIEDVLSVTGNGKALVSINGQWTEQEGYGYASEPTQIVWDDNFEDREEITIDSFYAYFISDITIPRETMKYSTLGMRFEDDTEYDECFLNSIYDYNEDVYIAIGSEIHELIVVLNDTVIEGSYIRKGIYCPKVNSIKYYRLTIPSIVHRIDEKYIPDISPVFIADYEVTSFEEVVDAIKAGKAIFCRLPSSDTGERFSNSIIPLRSEQHEELADGEKAYHLFEFTMFDSPDDRSCFIFAVLDEYGWQFAQAPIIADFIDIDGESLSDKIADIEDQIGDSITALDGINDGLEGLV